MSTAQRKGGKGTPGKSSTSGDDPKYHGVKKQPSLSKTLLSGLAVFAVTVAGLLVFRHLTVPKKRVVNYGKTVLTPSRLHDHCEKHIGPARIEKVTDGVYVAIGYDLANTILIQTTEGHVVVDVSMNPVIAERVRADLEAEVGKAPIHTIIYTHSHVDHVGGAGAWGENGTMIWGTDALTPHFFKQYGQFRKAESLRGGRQFGQDVALSELPCSGLGGKPDVRTTIETSAFLVPTHTFTNFTSFTVGGVRIELVEAHGETHDQLFVWLPDKSVLLPGDNYYHSFPNLYSIRGTSPRPIRAWVASLDAMRRLQPEFLVPSHTQPVIGRDKVTKQLTDYRDGIQWVYTATVRGANEGKTIDELAETISLPKHLRDQPALDELYGQIDWSVRAIYTNELGWFDGRPEELYKLTSAEESSRLLALIGGVDKVVRLANEAFESQDYRWTLYLLKLLRQAKVAVADEESIRVLEIKSLRGLGEDTINTNGRAYLFQVAKELSGEVAAVNPVLKESLVDAIPISLIFEVMMSRVVPELTIETHQTALYVLSGKKYYVTVRYGLVEIVEDEPLPNTPPPIGVLTTSDLIFRKIALLLTEPALAIAKGEASVTGDLLGFMQMQNSFEKGA